MKRFSTLPLAIGLWLLASQATAFNIANTPLFVTGNVAPNIVLTLDDSGSMQWAYVPNLCGESNSGCTDLNNRWPKSAHGNALYYNPNVTYTPPKDASGNALTTSFTAAWRNGFYTSGTDGNINYGTPVNLSTSYQPTAALRMGGAYAGSCGGSGGSSGSPENRECFMGHFGSDLGSTPIVNHTHTGNTGSSAYFVINDFVNADGSQSGSNPDTNLVSVYVNGILQTRVGNTNSSCGTRPSLNNQFRTYINGSTLRLCFRNHNTMRNKVIELVHKTGGAPLYGADVPAPAYYYTYNDTNVGCTGTAAQKKQLNACYTLTFVTSTSGPGNTDERQNFANWYSFYRTRNLATISSASLAFAELDPTTRVAWQALHTCRDLTTTTNLLTANCGGWTGTYGSNAIRNFDSTSTTPTHRQKFYNWLFKLPAQGGTPLREAMTRVGEYFSTSGENSPYDNDFDTANSGEYTCRRNFHILMTDGVWNGGGAAGEFDNTAVNNPVTFPHLTYDPTATNTRIFKDSTSNTLADIAFKYWRNDLRPTLTNNLTPIIMEVDENVDDIKDSNSDIFWNPKNNPATWQHMVNFTVGLGLTDYLTNAGMTWLGDMYKGSYFSIRDGISNWPAASAGTNGVPDLWHAAINSRGRFYSAEAPEDLVNAFSTIMANVKDATPSAAALAANSTKAEIGTRVYQAKFDTTKWKGHLYAYNVNPADGTLSGAVWDAATNIPHHGSRNIYIRNASGGADFQFSNLTSPQEAALDAGGLGLDRVAWLRGDTSKELRIPANPSGIFRNREVKAFEKVLPTDPGHWTLGDIISSDPEYVGSGSESYDQLPSSIAGQSSYASFVAYKNVRTPAIYVGANDGMLHAFSVTNGEELFAVIPNAVFSKLSALTETNYTHQFYVDGSPNSGDAFLNNGLSHASGWNTVVVSGLGAGGNSIIAVDATSTSSTTASRFMWEYTETDMGFTYSKPQVAKLNDGSWAAVFGNGYKPSGGGAYLYIVNLADGTLIRKIQAGSDPDNGLSTPVLIDTNNDKIMDTAYAGDLQGNVWKFDLTGATAASWNLANTGTPLFVAKDSLGNRQPITVQPTVAPESTSGGYWVFFGTGRFFAEEDIQTAEMNKTQSYYGIWDDGTAVPTYTARTDVLVAQTVITATTAQGFDVRVTSDNAVTLSPILPIVRGWYMDLPGHGERVVSESISVISNITSTEHRIVFVTVIPSSDPCDSGGTSWLMELDFTGSRPGTPVFDLDNSNTFDAGDMVTVIINGTPTLVPVSGIKSTVGIMDTPTWIDKDAAMAFKLAPGTSGAVITIKNKGKGSVGGAARVFWQQLM